MEDERCVFFTDDQLPFSLLTEKIAVGKTFVVFSSHLSLVSRGDKNLAFEHQCFAYQ